ncbi:MAG: FMN-binding protein [Planctomycetota bacterium]
MKNFIQESWLVLLLGVVYAGLLATAESTLGPKIAQNKRDELEAAVYAVVPEVASSESKRIGGREVFKCLNSDGELSGWALQAEGFGFQDKIKLVVGLSPDGSKITGLKVVENTETPGLGNKIEDEEWTGQYKALDALREVVVVKSQRKVENNEIQAITGATISSEAVTKIANKIIFEMQPKLDELRQLQDTQPRE